MGFFFWKQQINCIKPGYATDIETSLASIRVV